MKKRRILAAIVFAIMIFTYSSFTIYADASSITLDIKLDKEIYCIGDTATASVSISGVPEEMLNTNIGGFQIHLAFDTDVLKYKSGEIKLGGEQSLGVYGYNPGDANGVAGNIVALYAQDYTLTAPAEGGTLVLKVDFEVIGTDEFGKTPLVWFSDEQITEDCGYSCIMISDKNGGFSEIQCSFENEAVFAQTGKNVMYNPVAVYSDGTVIASADVVIPSDRSGVLIASLYNVENAASPRFVAAKTTAVTGTMPASVSFDGISSAENLKIKYYLFSGFSAISPLAFPTEAIVSAGGQ